MNKEETQQQIEMYEKEMLDPHFWDDKEKAQHVIAEIARLKDELLGDAKYDKGNAIINIFAGAGGDDAEDFTRMLYEMYISFAEKNNYSVLLLSSTPNNLNGYRNVSFEIQGKNAFKKLRGESGVHRLVRKSPFNNKGIAWD